MDVEIKVEPGRQEPRIVILAGEESEELRRLAEDLSRLTIGPVPVSRGEEKLLLAQGDFLRLLLADTRQLEERLDQTRFVRISNSEIINLDRVTAVDLSLSGTICMTLDGTVKAYVSRRYMKKIKEVLNMGRRNRDERR